MTISVEWDGARTNYLGMSSGVDRQAELARAWEELYRAHFPFVRRLVLRLGARERSDREDCIQAVFLAAWEGLPRFDARQSAKAWLAGIARHVVADWRRQRERAPEILRTEEDARVMIEALSQPPDQESKIEASDREALLCALLDALPQDERDVVAMAREGLMMPEIAATLGITVAAGYKRLERGHEKMAAALRRRRARGRSGAHGALLVLPLDALLRACEGPPEPAPESQARIWQRLQAARAALPVPRASERLRAAARQLLARHGPGALGGGAAVAVVALLLRGSGPGAEPVIVVTAPSATASPIALAEHAPASAAASAEPVGRGPVDFAERAPVSGPAPFAPSAPTAASAASAPRDDAGEPRDAEANLIAAAVVDLAAGRRADAIRSLEEHARRFPNGPMRADREKLLRRARAAK